jgi:hypothetical protein
VSSVSSPASARGLPSLLWVTLRRGFTTGRFYLAIGLLISLVLTVALLRNSHGSTVFESTFPLEIPLFASLGAMGGLMLFVGDRSKGVLEYLIAYGVRPRMLFVNCLLVTVALSTLVLGLALAVGLGGYLATGHAISTDLAQAVLGYTIPMTYASSLFAALCGMVWSTLSTPRAGLNSPVGVAPTLGVAPPIIVLILAESVDKSSYYDVTVGAAAGFVVLVLVLLAASARLMRRERFLSPM